MTSPKSENSPVLEIVARPSFGLGEIRGRWSAPIFAFLRRALPVDKGAERRWREMGAANQTDAKSALVQSMRRSIGIEAVRGHARLKLDRLAQMTGDMYAGAERR